jgi:hypothetical protein
MNLLLDITPDLTYTPHVQTCITCSQVNPKGLLYTTYGVMCNDCYKQFHGLTPIKNPKIQSLLISKAGSTAAGQKPDQGYT